MYKLKHKSRRKLIVAASLIGVLSITGVAGASVLVQNFMVTDFNAGAPPCLIKVAGEDSTFDGFSFDATTTATVDGVSVTQEKITIDGLTGDRVSAQEVYEVQNNCDVDLEVTLESSDQSGDWSEKYLEVWLGKVETPTGYPGDVADEYDPDYLVFQDGGSTTTTTDDTDGPVTVPAGSSVPVGMIVTTGIDATGTASATWTVAAEMP